MVGIVILNYNSTADIIRCVNSIIDTTHTPYKIYIVDNCSNEKLNEIEKFLYTIDNAVLLRSLENKGYACGNNIGIKKALDEGCDHILISNADVIYLNDAISILCKAFLINPSVGMAGPRIFNPDKTEDTRRIQEEFNISNRWKTTTVFKVLFRKFNSCFFGDRLQGQFIKAYTLPGCCLMFSKESINKIGLFDENTFLYEEENIVGKKLSKYQYNTVQCSEAEILHNHGSTTKNIKALAYIYAIASEMYYCKYYDNCSQQRAFFLLLYRKAVYVAKMMFHNDYQDHYRKYISETNKWR